MRIAFISTILGYPWGGADTLWTNAAEAAAARGDSLFVSVSPAVASSPRVAALRRAGAAVLERTPPTVPTSLRQRMTGKLRAMIGSADAVPASLAAFRPDLVIFSLGGTYDMAVHPSWFAWLGRSRTKFRLIANWQQENPVCPEGERSLARAILAAADRVCFVSARNMEVTRRHLLHPLPNARVIQNPLRWRPADVSTWPDDCRRSLATVSRLAEDKGIQLLLHAAAGVLRGENDWHLNVYGRGPAEGYLKATAAHLGLSERVTFRGYVDDLHAIWAENHLMVSPSIEDGVPMTIPEAMLCERPVLATEVGGAEDWLCRGATGFLCPAPALPLLSSTLRAAWAARDRWRSMGRAAARAALDRYRPDDYLTLLD